MFSDSRDSELASAAALPSLWIGLNIADIFWIYYFVQTSVDPVPHTAVNRTHAGFIAFEFMMFIFGFFLGCINAFIAYGYWCCVVDNEDKDKRSEWGDILFSFFNICVVTPVFIFLIIMPFFGGWIVLPIAQKYAWDHRCDSYPMYVILDGKAYNDPQFVKNVAYFYGQGHPVPLFTYELSNPGDADVWTFSLREWDSYQSTIPLDLYPTLQFIQYDFVNSTITGNCTTSISSTNSNTLSSICLSGTFDNYSPLFLNITSSVPLNTASNATAIPPSTVALRSQDKAWYFNDDAPSLILRELRDDTLEETALKTAVTKLTDCTELKVCVSGMGDRVGSVVGAEVMASLGLILMRQSDYALKCTDPSPSRYYSN